MKKRDIDYIEKRVERAIDAMIDIQDRSESQIIRNRAQRVLDMLNGLID